jgi:hypothetical protein
MRAVAGEELCRDLRAKRWPGYGNLSAVSERRQDVLDSHLLDTLDHIDSALRARETTRQFRQLCVAQPIAVRTKLGPDSEYVGNVEVVLRFHPRLFVHGVIIALRRAPRKRERYAADASQIVGSAAS